MALLVLIAALAGFGWTDSLEAIRAAAAGINTVQSPFTQEKHLRMLAQPLISKGRIIYRRPGELRWEYYTPIPSVILMKGRAFHRYQKIDGHWVEDTASSVNAMPVVVEEITNWLNGEFGDSHFFTAKLEPDRKILLEPKDASMARIIQHIILTLGDQPGVISTVVIHESPSSYTRILFDQPLINAPIDQQLFTQQP